MYTVAVNSELWLNGHSWGEDFECDPQIEKIDEDKYGRTMFTYYEKHYSGSDASFSVLIVCQYSNGKEAFYYEDVNYIVKKQVNNSQNLEKFSDEEKEYLKSLNDWNKEFNYDKCFGKSITKNKADVPFEKEIEKRVIDEFNLNGSQYSLFMNYLTGNSDDSKFIMYGYINKGENNGVYFIGLAEKENNSIKNINFLVPSDLYNYQVELTEFKKANGWK